MEISTTLLLALLFVGLLSFGIVNLLMTLAGSFKQRSDIQFYWVHTTWLILLLLVYLTVFWQATALFEVEQWGFGGLLYIIAGPVLLLFATEVLAAPTDGSADRRVHYYAVAGPFFIFLAAEQVWIVGVRVIIDGAVGTADLFNWVAMVLLLGLASSTGPRAHAIGAALGAALFVAAAVYQGLF